MKREGLPMSGLARIYYLVALLAIGVLATFWAEVLRVPATRGDWGIDACLTAHVDSQTRPAYLEKLSETEIGWLRERRPTAGMQRLHQESYHLLAFADFGLKAQETGNQLHENLRDVYRVAQSAGREFAWTVAAWEMIGESDIGFCTDLPDRVAAYQKALYLGLKAGGTRKPETGATFAKPTAPKNLKPEGSDSNALSPLTQASGFRPQASARAPLVLMGALGMPPGPWLERFAANDGLAYTDAYNFHFYGNAEDLTGVIEAHRAAIRAQLSSAEAESGELKGETVEQTQVSGLRSQVFSAAPLPMWITECGIEAVDKRDWLNPQRRQLQADFTISTAKQALAALDVAMFMPFILVHDKDPYAMTVSPTKTFAAWDAYAKFTRENPWPKRALGRDRPSPSLWPTKQGAGSMEQGAVNPVVVQWLPDNATCVPHKVSGTYRFTGGQPIKGELRVYNFGEREVSGRIEHEDLKVGRVILNAPKGSQHGALGITRPTDLIRIPSMGMVSVPVEFAPTTTGYFRETFEAKFVEVGRAALNAPSESKVSFGLETSAKLEDFDELPLALAPLPNGKIQFPQIEPYQDSEASGVWKTINGLKLAVRKPETGNLKPESYSDECAFWIEKENTDPLAPAMAVAAVHRLPSTGFLRLQLDKPMTKDRKVLVTLVDDRGQRYSIWENFGVDYYGSRSDVWLNLEDFHADFWGRMSADYRFRPERIREVQLRFYLDTPGDRVGVKLSLLRVKR